MRLLLAILLIVVLSGCIGTKCKEVLENYTVTETIVEKIPVNRTSPLGHVEHYVVERTTNIPLKYSIVARGSSVVKRKVLDGSDILLELGRLDQNISAYFWLVLKNIDDVDGNFTVMGSINYLNRSPTQQQVVLINSGQTRKLEFEFDIKRNQKWSYNMRITAPVKVVTTRDIVENYSKGPTRFVDFKYVKKTVEVLKTRTRNVC